MRVIRHAKARKTFPTGNPNFAVMQAFPAGITAEESDPWLMLDHFGPKTSKGKILDPDHFPVGWHPHRGMDIMTYLVEGVGRHADSLGNRGEFVSPGMQWISVGSGIEHAEGGGTPAGQRDLGFQIWVNVPSYNKMDNPRYGTEPPENLPLLSYDGVVGRLLAGPGLGSVVGPFATVTPTQLIDYIFQPNSNLVHIVPLPLDNCLVYVYQGSGSVCGTHVSMYDILRLDATDANMRDIHIQSDNDSDMAILLFSGKMLKEPIAWRGPFVMNTEKELQQTYADYKSGNLLLQRVPWNYKLLSEFPAHYHGLNDTSFSSWEEYQDIKT